MILYDFYCKDTTFYQNKYLIISKLIYRTSHTIDNVYLCYIKQNGQKMDRIKEVNLKIIELLKAEGCTDRESTDIAANLFLSNVLTNLAKDNFEKGTVDSFLNFIHRIESYVVKVIEARALDESYYVDTDRFRLDKETAETGKDKRVQACEKLMDLQTKAFLLVTAEEEDKIEVTTDLKEGLLASKVITLMRNALLDPIHNIEDFTPRNPL